MALGLARDGRADRFLQHRVIGAGAQGRAQIGHILLAEAHIQLARAGQPHPVAAFAEIMRERRDEADLLPCLFQPHIAGRPARALGQIGEPESFTQPRAQILERPILIKPILIAQIAHRHDLDKGQVHAPVRAPALKGEQLILVESLQRHGINLDLQPRLLRGLDPGQDLRQAPPARDIGEFLVIERVERDIDPPHPCCKQVVSKARQLAAIGGQRQFLQRATFQMPGHSAEERHDIAPHQRLAARDAQLFHTQPHEGRTHPFKLFQRQKLLLRQEGHAFRHAINTAEIAAIGDRDA